MKKIISFFLLLALMISAKAQYTRLVDYTDWTIGSHPYGDIISDGTYFYGMTRYGGTSYIGSAFKN